MKIRPRRRGQSMNKRCRRPRMQGENCRGADGFGGRWARPRLPGRGPRPRRHTSTAWREAAPALGGIFTPRPALLAFFSVADFFRRYSTTMLTPGIDVLVGLGEGRPYLRLNCPPEVTLLALVERHLGTGWHPWLAPPPSATDRWAGGVVRCSCGRLRESSSTTQIQISRVTNDSRRPHLARIIAAISRY